MNRALVVSIHDVSPLTRNAVAAMLDDLAALGVAHTSLLVVPNHHRRGHFLDDKNFCEWLRGLVARGHEAVIHGYFHERARKADDSTAQKAVTRIYTADEGEFFDIGENEARELVARARDEFTRAGLHPRGFIAPAWLLSKEAERALTASGIEYTTRLGSVTDLRRATVHRSQSLVWSTRSAWRRVASLAWNALLFSRLQNNPLLRIGLHPPDFQHENIRRQIHALTTRALSDRVPVTYTAWMDATRDGGSI